jgi:hypothetical protein
VPAGLQVLAVVAVGEPEEDVACADGVCCTKTAAVSAAALKTYCVFGS